MDIEEKLAKFRQSNLKKEADLKSTNENSLKKNFFFKYFFQKSTPEINQNSKLTSNTDKKQNSENLKKRALNLKKQPDPSYPLIIESDQPDQEECSPDDFKLKITKLILKFLLWATLGALFIKLEFGLVYLICSLLVIIYLNTNVGRRGPVSAYSVFNPNVQRLYKDGQLTAEQLEKI